MEYRISIAFDSATPLLEAELAICQNSTGLHRAMGLAVVEDTSEHVSEWGLSHPNKLGGRRTNHFAAVAAAINPDEALQVSEESAVMTLGGESQAGLTRAFGEVTITAGTRTAGVKFLAIPARTEAYGLRPRECPVPLAFAVLPRGGPCLVEVDRQKITVVSAPGKKAYIRKGKESGGGVWYWLRPSVTQPQDRSLLPSEEAWTESATSGARNFITIERERLRQQG